MATQLQLRKGTRIQNDAFTGAEGELTYNSTDRGLRLHDGSTQGGAEVPVLVYVQRPTAENGYTWARKYSDRWVEQGGRVTSGGGGIIVNLPVTMADVYYTITYAQGGTDNDYDSGADTIKTDTLTTTSFQLNRYASGATSYWEVKGYAAE